MKWGAGVPSRSANRFILHPSSFRLHPYHGSMSTAAPASIDPPIDLPADVKVAVVAARFNAHITDELLAGCVRRLAELGLDGERVETYRVPGAFELPVMAKALAGTKRIGAVICIGAVVR